MGRNWNVKLTHYCICGQVVAVNFFRHNRCMFRRDAHSFPPCRPDGAAGAASRPMNKTLTANVLSVVLVLVVITDQPAAA